jgi:hypothetical protein
MVDTNYGILLQKEDTPFAGTFTTIGEIVNLDPPSIVTGAIEKTHHGSGGYRQWIPDGLIGLEQFTVTLNLTADILDAMYEDMKDKLVALYKIVYPDGLSVEDWSFGAFPVSIDVLSSDAKSPDVAQVDITFQPSGEPDGIYT